MSAQFTTTDPRPVSGSSCVHEKYLLNEQMNILNHRYHLSNLGSI